MRLTIPLLLLTVLLSCGRDKATGGEKDIITVSIAPFSYFITGIAGDDFEINIMVPPGANPHIYEPAPGQIDRLRKSAAYISNGYLGFEITWLDRFYGINSEMKKVSLDQGIELIESEHHHEGDHHEGDHHEGADPHYWISPANALVMASTVRDLLTRLAPENGEKYERNYEVLAGRIAELDRKAEQLFLSARGKAFMIYHPNLAYLARDYGLEEVAVESEGKEPNPAQLRNLIDRVRQENMKLILVQKEFDTKNARAIAGETGAGIVIIDPLSPDWYKAVNDIIDALNEGFVKSVKN